MRAPVPLLAGAGLVLLLGGHRFVSPRAPASTPSAVPSAAAAPVPRAPLASAAWSFGNGPHALGRGTTPGGRPVAPASFVAEGAGVIVLDQENRRIVREDGTSFALPGDRADDIARAADGALAVLDRLGAKDVAVVDARGRLRGRLPLEGPGLDDAREVSRVVVSGGGVFVERNGGGPLLRIGGIDGVRAEHRDELPGIPTRGGNVVSAGITSEEQGRAWVTVADAGGEHRWTRELRFPGELTAVGFVEGGGDGAVWVVLLAGATRAEYTNWAVCLDETTGRVRGSVYLAVETPAWDSFRDFAVRDDGGLIAATRSAEGVAFTTYECDH